MESVDVPDSKSGAFAGVWVQVPPSLPAPEIIEQVPALRV